MRFGEIFEKNESQILSRIQGAIAQTLLRQAPPAFAAARAAIARFLGKPDSTHLAEVRGQLALVNPDQHPSVYQEISSEGQEKIRTLLLALEMKYPTIQHSILVDEISDQYALLEMDDTTRNHLSEALTILSLAIMQYNGSLVSALDFLNSAFLDEETGIFQRAIDSLKHKIFEGGGLLDELCGRLVIRNGSVLEQALQMLRLELTSIPHETIKHCRIALILLRQALQVEAARETLSPLMVNAIRLLEELDRNKEEIFRIRPVISEKQFKLLEGFRKYLQEFITDESLFFDYGEIQRQFQPVFQCVDHAFNSQTGAVGELTRVGDHLADRLDQLLERIENLPQRLISNTFSQGTVPNTEATTASLPKRTTGPVTEGGPMPLLTEPEHTSSSIPYNNILEQTSSILSQIMATACQAVSQRAAVSLATMMAFVFHKIKEHLEENCEHPHIIAAINPLIERVNTTRKNGSWSELIGTLQECMRVMQQQQVYLQGFRLPLNSVRSSPSAIPTFLANISSHSAALHDLRPPSEHAVSRAMIAEESLKLTLRVPAYGAIRLTNEYLLRLAPDHPLYASLVAIPPNTPTRLINEVFKTRYYAWIDQSNCSLVSKCLAKAAYYLAVPAFNFFAEALISNTVAFFQQWQDASEDHLHPKEIHIIQQLRNWLAPLSASYNDAAATPTGQVRDFQRMLELAIQAPERNGGLQPAELYSAFSATALDIYGPRFNWRSSITKHYDVQIPPTSSLYFLNPLLTTLNVFCTWTINAFLFVPEWVANTVMNWGTHLFLRYSPLLERNLTRTVDALKSNTKTSYGLNQAFYLLLQRVWKSMQISMTSEREHIHLQDEYSMSKKLEISWLAEYLLEVLNKSRYGTQDRMRAYLEGRLSFRDRAERELDDLFLPEALETTIGLILLSLDALMSEEAQNEFLFHMLAIANSAMDIDEPVAEKDCVRLEKAIRDQIDEILEASILYAIREKFDFSGERQKAGVHQFIQDLKNQSTSIARTLGSNLLLIDPSIPTNPRTHALLRSLIGASVNFQQERLDALSQADGNRCFHTETKQRLNDLSQQLANHLRPITDHLNQSLKIYEEITQTEQGEHLLLGIEEKLKQIESILSLESVQTTDIDHSSRHTASIQEALSEFQSLSHLFTNQQQLNPDWSQLRSAISKAQSTRHNIDILMQTPPLFERILVAKTQHLGSATLSPETRENERILATLIQTLPASFLHRSLLDQVLNLVHARTREDLTQAHEEYHRNLGYMTQESEQTLQLLKNLAYSSAQRLKEMIAQYRHYAAERTVQSQNGLKNQLDLLAEDLRTLNGWAEEVQDIPIWNFFVFDMHGITDITTSLAYNRAKQKVNELTQALYQGHNYIGAIHHLFLLPFLKKYGPQHLRQT